MRYRIIQRQEFGDRVIYDDNSPPPPVYNIDGFSPYVWRDEAEWNSMYRIPEVTFKKPRPTLRQTLALNNSLKLGFISQEEYNRKTSGMSPVVRTVAVLPITQVSEKKMPDSEVIHIYNVGDLRRYAKIANEIRIYSKPLNIDFIISRAAFLRQIGNRDSDSRHAWNEDETIAVYLSEKNILIVS